MTLALALADRWRQLLFGAAVLPFTYLLSQAYLSVQGFSNALGSDPGKALTDMSGNWALRFMLLTLFVTPLTQLFSLRRLPRARRMLGLFTFFYAAVHLLCYLTFLIQWQPAELLADFQERPYITVGILAFGLLIPLAVTSNGWMMRKLGRFWKRLHRLLYLIVLLALIHLVWQLRSDFGLFFLYSGLAFLALGYRLLTVVRSKVKQPSLAAPDQRPNSR